jgi:aryl-alcohol dehydrogenase-like predicted oxidoreductase
VVAPVVGPRTFQQLENLLAAMDITLTAEEHARLAAHTQPPEMYPYRMLSQQLGLRELAQLKR